MSPRRGEFSGLKWENVDFENDLIYLANNRVMVNGKAMDKAKLKTKSSKRVLVMSDFVKNELLAHKAMNQYLDSPYVCATVFSDSSPINPDYITRVFPKITERVFGFHMRVHDLRHSFNQIAYEDDVDEATRSKIMGHSKVLMTRNTYTKSSLKRNKDAMNLISSEIETAFNA